MHWRIHAPGRAPFDYWSYALTHDGQTYTESFEVAAAAGQDVTLVPATSPAYTLRPQNNTPDYHSGRRFDVLRDGVPVATICEDPERTGGRRAYGKTQVSMSKIVWAGERPDDARDLRYCDRPTYLLFDFVSRDEAQTAEETLPEVVERVERLLAWRARRAADRAAGKLGEPVDESRPTRTPRRRTRPSR